MTDVDGDGSRILNQSQDCTLVRVIALPPSNRCWYWNNPTTAIPCQKLNFWRGVDFMICHKNLFGNYLRGVRVAPNKPPSDNQHLSQKFDPKNFKEFQRIAPVTLRLCSCRRRGTACAQCAIIAGGDKGITVRWPLTLSLYFAFGTTCLWWGGEGLGWRSEEEKLQMHAVK